MCLSSFVLLCTNSCSDWTKQKRHLAVERDNSASSSELMSSISCSSSRFSSSLSPSSDHWCGNLTRKSTFHTDSTVYHDIAYLLFFWQIIYSSTFSSKAQAIGSPLCLPVRHMESSSRTWVHKNLFDLPHTWTVMPRKENETRGQLLTPMLASPAHPERFAETIFVCTGILFSEIAILEISVLL